MLVRTCTLSAKNLQLYVTALARHFQVLLAAAALLATEDLLPELALLVLAALSRLAGFGVAAALSSALEGFLLLVVVVLGLAAARFCAAGAFATGDFGASEAVLTARFGCTREGAVRVAMLPGLGG